MKMLAAVRSVLRQFDDFTGVSSRPEFWWFVLFSVVAHLSVNSLNIVTPQGTVYLGASLSGAFGIAILVPTIAVTVRRLRDSGRSALYLLWLLLPVAGPVVVIVLLAQPSRPLIADAPTAASAPATAGAN
ncbi:uncharacterized membrane protein YhaH (DUF805 family) [Compostimonas suwonensis]|uniref:Uncharacterized membrane protein YhaH (DUF805 family) n=2 Tax=Compostimonas suwonensis TaxID=1048394 RepID=A0A2M9BVZ9_9MICO|nr:uncharacterized membrane protein YhaH (DUF805 family) [Compostimonas suwonensis]